MGFFRSGAEWELHVSSFQKEPHREVFYMRTLGRLSYRASSLLEAKRRGLDLTKQVLSSQQGRFWASITPRRRLLGVNIIYADRAWRIKDEFLTVESFERVSDPEAAFELVYGPRITEREIQSTMTA